MNTVLLARPGSKAGNPHPAVSAVLFLLLSPIVTSCSQDDAGQSSEPVVRPVKMFTVSPTQGEELFRFPAVIDAGQYAELSFQVSGLIEEILIVDSQEVDEGDVLVRLNSREFRNRLAAARAQYESAVTEYERAVRLAKEDAIASSVLEQRATQKDIAKAQLDTAEKALEDSVLRAPFSGTIAQLTAEERQNVVAGQLVMKLVNLDTMEAYIDMPENLVAVTQQYDTLGTYVILDSAPDTRIPAVKKEATLIADPATQTYRVVGTFVPPPDLLILPGMNATAEIEAVRKTLFDSVSVPISAIYSDGETDYVWIVDQDTMVVNRREVTIVDGIGAFAIVTEGLAASDTIAAAGAAYLMDGMQVRPWVD